MKTIPVPHLQNCQVKSEVLERFLGVETGGTKTLHTVCRRYTVVVMYTTESGINRYSCKTGRDTEPLSPNIKSLKWCEHETGDGSGVILLELGQDRNIFVGARWDKSENPLPCHPLHEDPPFSQTLRAPAGLVCVGCCVAAHTRAVSPLLQL